MNRFRTTRWSLVIGASDAAHGALALDQLCRIYRPPVLAYIRRHARNEGEAEDLAQGFFEQLLRLRMHATADPARGRFRSYLLCALKRYLAKQRVAAYALKRGSDQELVTLGDPQAPEGPASEADTPDAVFERAWAEALLGRAMAHLQAEAAAAGKLELFRALRAFILEAPAADEYAVVAERLGMRRNTLAVAIHRLRQRLHERLREEVAETVDAPADLEAEMDALGSSLRSASTTGAGV